MFSIDVDLRLHYVSDRFFVLISVIVRSMAPV